MWWKIYFAPPAVHLRFCFMPTCCFYKCKICIWHCECWTTQMCRSVSHLWLCDLCGNKSCRLFQNVPLLVWLENRQKSQKLSTWPSAKHPRGYQALSLSDRGEQVVRSWPDTQGRLLQVLLGHQCLLEAREQVAVGSGVSQCTGCLQVDLGQTLLPQLHHPTWEGTNAINTWRMWVYTP